jgi:hypothetical protein
MSSLTFIATASSTASGTALVAIGPKTAKLSVTIMKPAITIVMFKGLRPMVLETTFQH